MLFSAKLPWCSFMCRKQIFSKWPENPRRQVSENIKNTSKRWRPGGPHPSHEGAPPRVRPPYLVGPWMPSDANSNSIYLLSERKNQREEIIAFYDTEPPPSPNLSREGWSGVHSAVCSELRGDHSETSYEAHNPSGVSVENIIITS